MTPRAAIHWTRTQPEARAELLDSYRADVTKAPDKSRFIFAYTNLDVAELNKGAREVQRQLGRLGDDHELETADGRMAFRRRRPHSVHQDRQEARLRQRQRRHRAAHRKRPRLRRAGRRRSDRLRQRRVPEFSAWLRRHDLQRPGRHRRPSLSVSFRALALGGVLCRDDPAPRKSRAVRGDQHRRKSRPARAANGAHRRRQALRRLDVPPSAGDRPGTAADRRRDRRALRRPGI